MAHIPGRERSPRDPIDGGTPKAAAVGIALATIYLVWGSTYLAIRMTVEEIPPISAMGVRFLAAGLLLATFVMGAKGTRHLWVGPRQVAGSMFLGIWMLVLSNGMVAVAVSHGATSGLAALLNSIAPLVVVGLRAVDRDVPPPATIAGVVLGFVGVALLLLDRGGDSSTPLGPALLVVLAASSWAIGSYAQPRLRISSNPLVVAVWEMVTGGIMMLVIGAIVGERLTLSYSLTAWLSLLYLIVFGAGLAYSAYIWLVANAPISLVSTHAYVNPAIAVVLGWLVLSERVTATMVLGGLVIVVGIALVANAESKRHRAGVRQVRPTE